MSKRALRFMTGVIVVFLFVQGVLFLGVYDFPFLSKKVIRGVSVQGIDLAGLDWQKGQLKLQKLEDRMRSRTFILKYKDKIFRLPASSVGVSLDKKVILQQALAVGRQGGLWERRRTRRYVQADGFEVPAKVRFDKAVMSNCIGNITSGITVESRNAALKINNNNKIEIVPSKDGLEVDQARLYKDMADLLEKGKPAVINLRLVKTAPELTTEDIKKMEVNELLGAYRTVFNPDNSARAYNIRVAASALDGLFIPPHKTVSFNDIVGPRSSEAGYKDAGVIINNELIQGPGGGVCQVSTTLYNSVLLAGLEVVERSNHSLPVNYVPIGRDATVAYKTIDFKFRNSTGKHIYIKTITEKGSLTIKILGNEKYKRDVSVQTWITKTFEPNIIYEKNSELDKGQEVVKQEGAKGYLAEGVRIFNDGAVRKEEPLPISKYHPVNRIIYIGSV